MLQLWRHYAAAATRPVRWCLVAAAGPATLFYGMLLQVRVRAARRPSSLHALIHTLGLPAPRTRPVTCHATRLMV